MGFLKKQMIPCLGKKIHEMNVEYVEKPDSETAVKNTEAML